MESKALEILQTILQRRGIRGEITNVTDEKPDRTNLYKIGDTTVLVSQKDKGLQDKELRSLVAAMEANGLTKNGLIVVAMASPSENLTKTIRSLCVEMEGRFQFFYINELQFDITTHRMVSPHRVLTEEERTEFLAKMSIRNPEAELPTIDILDTMARWIGAKQGDIVLIDRHSDVGGSVPYWRYCLA